MIKVSNKRMKNQIIFRYDITAPIPEMDDTTGILFMSCVDGILTQLNDIVSAQPRTMKVENVMFDIQLKESIIDNLNVVFNFYKSLEILQQPSTKTMSDFAGLSLNWNRMCNGNAQNIIDMIPTNLYTLEKEN